MRYLSIIIMFLISIQLISCSKEDNISNELTGEVIRIPVPSGFPPPQMFLEDPLTKEGVNLGKKLFYDGRLSKDGSVSCASCHQQVAVFGTYDHDLSHGIYNQHSTRNAPPLFNLAWYSSFGWDGRHKRIEDIAEAHIMSTVDMAGNFSVISERVKKDQMYPGMFRAAFGSADVNKERILKALQQFTGSIVSFQTRYDSVHLSLVAFTPKEELGYQLFKKHCNSCHQEPLFTDNSFRNNGLPVTNLNDIGRAYVTGLYVDRYKFKVPSLRNLFLTFPFMHDGRFIGFSQIYDHYSRPGSEQNNLTDNLLGGGIALSQAERDAITAFLRTLTDFDFANRAEYGGR